MILLGIVAALLVISIGLLYVAWRKSLRGADGLERTIREEFRALREESARAARELRDEIGAGQRASAESLSRTLGESVERVRSTLDLQLKSLQESNEKKLEQMRATVDEKLQSTLEKRLGESFKLVSERLEAVQRGLGEMQNLAAGVSDLKRILSNVKARGTWAEVQLGALMEQILAPDQYARNVSVREDSREFVEYAVRLPGPDSGPETPVWLPIDSKFPQEDYLRLLEAAERADPEGTERAAAALARAIQTAAKDIAEKYIAPPRTTDFAIMFLSTEGLYAEVLRQPGQVEELQRRYRVVIAGPTTLAAILSSLRLGFQTLALQKHSREVWEILAAVKTEFGKFGETLGKVKKRLHEASEAIERTEVRTRAMERKLRGVEQLPGERAEEVLELGPEGDERDII